MTDKRMIKSKMELSDWLKYELKRYGGGNRFRFVLISERDVIKRHQVLLRKTEYHINTHHKIRAALYKIKLNRIQNKYGLHIPPNTCMRGLRIMHVGSILLNGRCEVGEDCVFHINTALVAGGVDGRAPKLGKHVIVGIGAIVLGGISVADNVAIGANAVVNKDVLESNIAVAGVPAKKISNNGSLEWGKDFKKNNNA